MKAIKTTNSAELEVALAAANAQIRNLTAADIQAVIKRAEDRLLTMGIAKSNHKGASFAYENGYKMPCSYNGRPESTQFDFEKRSADWYVTAIRRGDCDHKRGIFFKNESEFRKLYKF